MKIQGDPIFCPWCHGRQVTFINGWRCQSIDDPTNVCDLDEYQCAGCDNRSFWV